MLNAYIVCESRQHRGQLRHCEVSAKQEDSKFLRLIFNPIFRAAVTTFMIAPSIYCLHLLSAVARNVGDARADIVQMLVLRNYQIHMKLSPVEGQLSKHI
jgi:hypothetical protein